MGASSQPHLDHDLDQVAIERVLTYLTRTKKNGRLVYPRGELSKKTGLSPTQATSVMAVLETEGPFTVRRQSATPDDCRWLVRGSAYDLDGWGDA